jgi:hypothetical protein
LRAVQKSFTQEEQAVFFEAWRVSPPPCINTTSGPFDGPPKVSPAIRTPLAPFLMCIGVKAPASRLPRFIALSFDPVCQRSSAAARGQFVGVMGARPYLEGLRTLQSD